MLIERFDSLLTGADREISLSALVCELLGRDVALDGFSLDSLDLSDLVRAQLHEVGHLEPPGACGPRTQLPDDDWLDVVSGAQLQCYAL